MSRAKNVNKSTIVRDDSVPYSRIFHVSDIASRKQLVVFKILSVGAVGIICVWLAHPEGDDLKLWFRLPILELLIIFVVNAASEDKDIAYDGIGGMLSLEETIREVELAAQEDVVDNYLLKLPADQPALKDVQVVKHVRNYWTVVSLVNPLYFL